MITYTAVQKQTLSTGGHYALKPPIWRMIYMPYEQRFYLVEASALPEVFLKVVEAKRLLQTGEAATVHQATTATGISRSAFYKYRDAIMPFSKLGEDRIITFNLMLKDITGVLSGILLIFSNFSANILTINQSIPANGCAFVTISANTGPCLVPVDTIITELGRTDGVIKVEIPGG